MVQAIGAVLVLIGAMAWHIAHAAKGQIKTVGDVWDDYLKVMQGKDLA